MASVCAGSIALMDAGIKIKSNVSGIAMGLISEGDKYAVLSDILEMRIILEIWILKSQELKRESLHVKWT